MNIKMLRNFECYIKNDYKKYSKDQIIENATEKEVAFLVWKKGVAEVYKEETEPYPRAEREQLIQEAKELAEKGVLPNKNWRKLGTEVIRKMVEAVEG